MKESTSNNKSRLYDSYIKAIRWASDWIEGGGLIGFIHNGSMLNSPGSSGLRKSLEKEFDMIYSFNLRGDQRTKGELSKKEGGQIFGASSRAPVAISFFIKNPEKPNPKAIIKYYDIGDYLKREDKLEQIKQFESLGSINWKVVTPDKHGDWLNQRDSSFYEFLPLGDRNSLDSIFDLYSLGVATNRDEWAYDFDKQNLTKNMKRMIDFYNEELIRLGKKDLSLKNIDHFIDLNPKKISWSSSLKPKFINKVQGEFKEANISLSSYRPFTKSWFYYCNMFTHRCSQMPKIFYNNIENKVICISGKGAKSFSALMTNHIPDFNFITPTQCFPLYRFDKSGNLKYAISDKAFNKFKTKLNQEITKEDIFYYIYGLLHSKDYIEKYKFNLEKDLPRIPVLKSFKEFSKIGKDLSKLHLNYEIQKKPQGIKILKHGKETSLSQLKDSDLRVIKMKHPRKNKQPDKSQILFNDHITLTNIPLEVYDYKINDCPAVKWIMERYQVKTKKNTEFVSDPNNYSEDPAYVLKLLLSVMTVSLETERLKGQLPPFDLESPPFKKAG